MVATPPSPAPMYAPMRSAFPSPISIPESSRASCAATTPRSKNRSRLLASRLSIQRVASKFFTSPANLVAKSLVSKSVMGAMPDVPAVTAVHVSSTPIASGVTSPIPVTTTLRAFMLRLRVRLDVFDRVFHGLDLLGVLVGDLDAEVLFERQHQLDHRQRVGFQIVGEGSLRTHLLGRHFELRADD